MYLNRFLIFIIVISVISCSSLRFEKKRYSKGFFVSSAQQECKRQNLKVKNISSDKIAHKPEQEKITVSGVSDTVIVYLKNGKSYQGVISEEKENGVFLTISKHETIFITRVEIVSIVIARETKQSNYNNIQSNTGNKKEDYYTIGRKAKRQPNERKEAKDLKELDASIPKDIITAKRFFKFTAISTFIPGVNILFPVFFFIGAFYFKRGYAIAKSNPEKFDMGRIEEMNDSYKVMLIVMLIFTLALLVLLLFLFVI